MGYYLTAEIFIIFDSQSDAVLPELLVSLISCIILIFSNNAIMVTKTLLLLG